MGDIFFAPISASQAPRGSLALLGHVQRAPHLQQVSFLPGSLETSTSSRMRHFTHPTLSLPSPSKLRASTSVKRTTAVRTPPKRLYSLRWSPRSGLPSAMHSAATTSSLVTVSSRSLTSRDLFETKDLISAFSPTAWSSAFSRAETSPTFLRTRRISSRLVLRMERTYAPSFWGFTFAFIAFRIST